MDCVNCEEEITYMALIKCTNCGEAVSDRADVCPHCGATIIADSTTELLICAECGTEIPEGSESCPKCGCPVSKNREVRKTESSSVQTAKTPATLLQKKKKIIVLTALVLLIASLAVWFFFFRNGSVAYDPYKELVGKYVFNDEVRTEIEFREDRTGRLIVGSGALSVVLDFRYELVKNTIIMTVTGEVASGQVITWEYEFSGDSLTTHRDEMTWYFKRTS